MKNSMVCAFSIKSNSIKGGETLGLYIDALSDSGRVVGRSCIIKVYEMDKSLANGKETTPDDLIAEFTSFIYGNQEGGFYFSSRKTNRTDSFDRVLPEPILQVAPSNEKLPVPLKYKPPYFYLFLDAEEHNSEKHLILITGQSTETEYGLYEIGFTVEIENKIVFDSRRIPAYVNCDNLLSENCINVAECTLENNELHKKRHLCGTHYGNMFIYRFNSEEEYMREVTLRSGAAMANLLKEEWNAEFKEMFEKHLLTYNLQMIDCIGFVIKVLEAGFNNTTMNNEWLICKNKVGTKMSGQVLAKALVDIGWVAIFYAPDTNNWYDKDPTQVHTYSYLNAMQYNQYGNESVKPIIPLCDLVINYSPTLKYSDGSTEVSPTVPELDKIDKIMKIPFAYIIGRYGQHTALLVNGKIYEVHWSESCYSDHLFDNSRSFLYNHTPKTWDWLSGIIVTPKIFWKKEPPNLKDKK
jgi:hypothetical protein